MPEKNPLDDIVDDLVVFKHENGDHISNSPMWNDSRVRDHWMKRHGPDAQRGVDDESDAEDEEVEDVEGDDYETWTNDALRTELAARELSVDGKKADLVNRLRKDDAENPPE